MSATTNRKAPMEITFEPTTSQALRKNWGSMLDQIEVGKANYQVRRYNQPLLALLRVSTYEALGALPEDLASLDLPKNPETGKPLPDAIDWANLDHDRVKIEAGYAWVHLRVIQNQVGKGGLHVGLTRYGKLVAVMVPIDWLEDATAKAKQWEKHRKRK